MCGFSIPKTLNEADSTFVYKQLFGLERKENSGFLGSVSYYLSRMWINLTGGTIVKGAISQIVSLTDEQIAVVLATLHRNPKKFAEHPEALEFLRKIKIRDSSVLTSKNVELIYYTAEIGRSVLLKKLLELKPNANVNAKNRYGQTAIIMAALSGEVNTIKLLHEKGADLTVKVQNDVNRSLLEYLALLKRDHAKDESFLYLYKTKIFDDETVFRAMLEGAFHLSIEMYKTLLSELKLDFTNQVSLFLEICERRSEDEAKEMLTFLKSKLEKREMETLIESCQAKIASRINSSTESLRSSSSNYKETYRDSLNNALAFRTKFNEIIKQDFPHKAQSFRTINLDEVHIGTLL